MIDKVAEKTWCSFMVSLIGGIRDPGTISNEFFCARSDGDERGGVGGHLVGFLIKGGY
jgi:hypothetical protein